MHFVDWLIKSYYNGAWNHHKIFNNVDSLYSVALNAFYLHVYNKYSNFILTFRRIIKFIYIYLLLKENL